MTTKRILWFSRHEPQQKQVEDLHEIFGDIEIIQESKSVSSAKEVVEIMKLHGCDEVVAVLPMHLYAELLSFGIKPLKAIMKRIIKENDSVEFIHDHFERILKVEVMTERL